MLLKIIMSITNIIVTLAFYSVTTPAIDKRRGKYFGVNLNIDNHDEIFRLTKNYRKANNWLLIVLLLLTALSFFYNSSTLILLTHVIVFIGGLAGFYGSIIKYTMKFDRYLLNSENDILAKSNLRNWRYGIFYYNEFDDKLIVAQRFGLGMTMNMAKRLGKVIYIAAFLLIIMIYAYVIYTIVQYR